MWHHLMGFMRQCKWILWLVTEVKQWHSQLQVCCVFSELLEQPQRTWEELEISIFYTVHLKTIYSVWLVYSVLQSYDFTVGHFYLFSSFVYFLIIINFYVQYFKVLFLLLVLSFFDVPFTISGTHILMLSFANNFFLVRINHKVLFCFFCFSSSIACKAIWSAFNLFEWWYIDKAWLIDWECLQKPENWTETDSLSVTSISVCVHSWNVAFIHLFLPLNFPWMWLFVYIQSIPLRLHLTIIFITLLNYAIDCSVSKWCEKLPSTRWHFQIFSFCASNGLELKGHAFLSNVNNFCSDMKQRKAATHVWKSDVVSW